MKITSKRMREILNSIFRELIEYIPASEILRVFEDRKSWEECFDDLKRRHEEDIFGKIVGYKKDSIDQEEFEEIIHPYIAGLIAESLGAKKVTIEW